MQTKLLWAVVVFGMTKTVVIVKQYPQKVFSIKHSTVKIYLLIGAIRLAKACYSDLSGPLTELFTQNVILHDVAN